MPDYDYLLIGGGMAADAAARGIRDADPDGTIGLIGAEPFAPYNRPPLSRGLWQDYSEDEIMRETDELGVDLHLGRTATNIDRQRRQVTDDSGTTYGYRKLLLATGGQPRRLSGPDDGVIYYRTLADYRRLRQLTSEPARVLVIGGGWIGAELAAVLTDVGHSVAMAFPEPGLLARLLPAGLSSSLTEQFRSRGVTVHAGRLVRSAVNGLVTFEDGAQEQEQYDAVVAGLGIIPATGLAEASGLTVSDGIEVDEFMQTSDPDILAAGDVASVFSPALGMRRRVEHEENANLTGWYAGQAMAQLRQPFTLLPMFYSELFGQSIDGVGLVDSGMETVERWEEPDLRGTIYYLADGRVKGALMWNSPGRIGHARELIEQGGSSQT